MAFQISGQASRKRSPGANMALHPVPLGTAIVTYGLMQPGPMQPGPIQTQWRAGLHAESKIAAMSHEIGFGLVGGGMGYKTDSPFPDDSNMPFEPSCCSERAVRIADEPGRKSHRAVRARFDVPGPSRVSGPFRTEPPKHNQASASRAHAAGAAATRAAAARADTNAEILK